MKIICSIDKEISVIDDPQETTLTVDNEKLENGWWKLEVDGDEFSVSGKELKMFCQAVLSAFNSNSDVGKVRYGSEQS